MTFKLLVAGATLAALGLVSESSFATGQPKIERTAAEKTALSRVPGGRVVEGELETEHGRLVWSFDIAQQTSPNIIEVQVDAMTGQVVAMETETPDQQAKEAEKEKKKPKKE
jgi:uncharacterized membrane protein YkoI